MERLFPTKRKAHTMVKEVILETFKREKVLSVANILITTITFLVLGIFLTLVFITQSTLTYLEQQTQVTAFFKDDFTEDKIKSLQKKLESDPRVSSVEYVSKEKALEIFTELNKDEPMFLQSASAKILPASINVKTKDIQNLPVLAGELAKLEGVEGVKFFKDVVESFQSIASVIYIVGFVLSAIFVFISYATVVLLLRSYISRKGAELSILKLVGASDEYVKKPIVAQGVFFSVFSAVIASLIILISTGIFWFAGGSSVNLTLPFSQGSQINILALAGSLSGIILISGFVLGHVGSSSAVRKYLKY